MRCQIIARRLVRNFINICAAVERFLKLLHSVEDSGGTYCAGVEFVSKLTRHLRNIFLLIVDCEAFKDAQ